MVELGQKVRFDPFAWDRCPDVTSLRCEVTGTVTAIYPKQGWFSVEYGNNQRTSFRFTEVGSVVKLIG